MVRNKSHTSLLVIVAAATMLVVTSAVMFYSARSVIQRTSEQLVKSELGTIASNIRKQLAKVEVAVNNMDWVLRRELAHPDTLAALGRQLVADNPAILGLSISFRPHYYPSKGRLFESYALRTPDGSVTSRLLASPSHDYTRQEFYSFTMEQDSDHWSEPYTGWAGNARRVTTYSRAVHDRRGEVVAVVGADFSMEWLEELMDHPKQYPSTYRFLLSRRGQLMAGGERGRLAREGLLEVVQGDSDRQGYVAMTDSAGEKQHVFYYPVGGITGWTLICVCSDSEIFGPLRRTRRVLTLLQLAGVLLVGFIVWRSSRNLKRLREVGAEKDRIDGELRVASEIQQSMLPEREWQAESESPPGWKVEIYGSLVPAREVGGDLFDYYVRDGKLFFCIGDVSGKGAASALVMSVTHTLFRAASAHETNPARILHTINETGCQRNESNMFVTLFVGVLDLPTGQLLYCNAGHDKPMIVAPPRGCPAQPEEDSPVESLPAEPHLPLGVFKEVSYGAQQTLIAPGTTLFLYTDGLTEAKNKEHRQFGLGRVREVLTSGKWETPRQLLAAMDEAVKQFVGHAEQSDDLTMMAIRFDCVNASLHYCVNADAPATNTITQSHNNTIKERLVMRNEMGEMARFSSFIKPVLQRAGVVGPLAGQLRLAIEEAVVNVVEYAYPAGTAGEITVDVASGDGQIEIVITDAGLPFDPTAKEKPVTSLPLEERPVGGLGILLVRELMDTVSYQRIGGKNILTLTKNLTP